ncbi:MAG: hypothetical protein JW804_09125 [Sedimentisphaerales bacterium]|nr:hypothetical protein [Sedimentisphaerales bacterium]
MDGLAEYFVLLGQGEDEGWMQILVFIVMAVIWVIGGIMKSRSEKQKQQEKVQGQPVRPVRPKARTIYQEKAPKQPPARPKPRPLQERPAKRPTFDRIFAPDRIKQKIIDKIFPQQKPVELKTKPAVTSPKPTEAAIQTKMIKARDEKEKAGAVVGEVVLDFGEPEQLQAAIIHYEILGKCVGQREIEEQIWSR